MKKLALFLAVLIEMGFTSALAAGQTELTGTIAGRVVDRASNESIPGVAVFIEGTSFQSMTDLDGRYKLNVPEGQYTIVCRYIGYQPKAVSGIKVSPKEVVNVDAMLDIMAQNINEVIIVADMKRENIGSILLMQKRSATIQDGISAESIKRTSDKNSGEVVRRMSGASTQEGKFVIIRGLGERYTNATLNGVPMSSTEPDKKAFSFDLFPSSLLDNIIVTKTAMPELPGEFAGGIIQINTRDIPDRNFLTLSAGTGMNSQSTFKSYRESPGGKTDWLGKDDGTRALPDGFPTTEELKKLKTADKIAVSKTFKNDWGINNHESSPVSQSYHLSTGLNKKIFKNDFGLIGALSYSRSAKTVFVNRGDYDYDGQRNYNFDDEQFKDNVFWGGLLNMAYKIGTDHKISLKNMYSVNSEDQVISRTGDDYENGQYISATAVKYTSSVFQNTTLSGDHYLSDNKSRITWYGSYNHTKQSVPNLRRMYYYRNLSDGTDDTTLYAYVPFGNASPNYAGKFYSELDEKNYKGEVNYSIPMKFLGDNQSVKVGYFDQYKSREFDARAMGFVVTNPGLFNYNLLLLPIDSLFTPEHMGTNGFRIDEITNPSDRYTAASNLHAGYVQFDNLLFNKYRMVWGVRVENFIQKLHTLGYSNDTIDVRTNYVDILPSLNFTYPLGENSNLRFAASKTVARPEFRELAPFGFYDFSTASTINGNDSLKRTEIYNFDLRYEIYPSAGELLSASIFYKDFTNPIEPFVQSSGAGSRTISFTNAPGAYLYGGEIEFRKKLTFLDKLINSSQLENLSLFGNVAYMKSVVDKSTDLRAKEDRPMQGQSPYIVNVGATYANPKSGLGITVVLNRIGRRIYQVGNSTYLSIYETPRTLLDCQVSKRLFDKAEIKFGVSDILNQEGIYYQDQNNNGRYAADVDSGISTYKYGINYSLSMSYSF